MKLLIQIPCYNEEKDLLQVLQSLPNKLEGISHIAIQLVDDGSIDHSRKIALDFGVDYILESSIPNNKKLGLVFQRGQKNALDNDYDILVNIDADNQYPASRIKDLIAPILMNKADLVIANRNPSTIKYFSNTKKIIQKISNYVMSLLCFRYIPDAVSGFRAFNKKALQTLILTEQYTYTIESLMQSFAKKLVVDWIEVEVNETTRSSRLISNIPTKILKSGSAALKFFVIYNIRKIISTLTLLILLLIMFIFVPLS